MNLPPFRSEFGAIAMLSMAPAFGVTCNVSIANDSQLAAQNTFSTLAAGSTVCIAPGIYTRQLTIAGTTGTAAQPINFVVGPTSGTAEFSSGVLLRNVSYVSVSGLTVSLNPNSNQYGAVILDTGTKYSSIRGFIVQNSFLGIAIGSANAPAGVGNSITNNTIQNNWNTGIAVGALSDGSSTSNNIIQNNVVSGNGGHGIEVTDANFASVVGNTLSNNGTGVNSARQGGYSGIHLYASASTTVSSTNGVRCTANVVSMNTVIGTLERTAAAACDDGTGSGHCTDGNGIQIDRYCSANTVNSNVTSANSGNGISVYGATGNKIYNNFSYGNNKQTSRRNFFPGPAEISVSAINLATGTASGNTVYNNTAITTNYQIPAFYQSSNAGSNSIGPNNVWWWNSLATPDASWGSVYIGTTWYSTPSSVNSVTGTSGNFVGNSPQ